MTNVTIDNGHVTYADGTTRPASAEEVALYNEVLRMRSALNEVAVCGTGFLQGACDADCVARTMKQIVAEYRSETAGAV